MSVNEAALRVFVGMLHAGLICGALHSALRLLAVPLRAGFFLNAALDLLTAAACAALLLAALLLLCDGATPLAALLGASLGVAVWRAAILPGLRGLAKIIVKSSRAA